jgi:hypothetical protein
VTDSVATPAIEYETDIPGRALSSNLGNRATPRLSDQGDRRLIVDDAHAGAFGSLGQAPCI